MGAGTWESHHAITTLMFRYAECVDAADFDGHRGALRQRPHHQRRRRRRDRRPRRVRKLYERTNRVHADGTMRTRHVTANVDLDIDEVGGHGDGPLGRSSCSSRRRSCRCSRS